LSIAQLKQIFIPDNKEVYEEEIRCIMHDLDLELNWSESVTINARILRAAMVLMLTNRYIWENESKARAGGSEQDKLLKLTHSINGVRTTAKNIISRELGERVDLKVDCLAADLVKEFGNWNIFQDEA
jgi:hypothetical protein